MRKTLIVLAAAALAALPAAGHGYQKKAVEELMQKKLDRSQKLLAGIALNDFDEIRRNAEDLLDISKVAEWRVLKTPRYELFSNEFQRNAEEIIKAAKAKNLDAATVGYVDLTLTCVKCHKHVREVRMVRLEKEGE
jgi:hypothetical protein